MNISITKRFEFDAAHRLYKYEGKCGSVHGHRFILDLTISGEVRKETGMIIDFNDISKVIGLFISNSLDHSLILDKCDPATSYKTVMSRNVFTMDDIPTVENLVLFLYDIFSGLIDDETRKVSSITLYETPTSSATITV